MICHPMLVAEFSAAKIVLISASTFFDISSTHVNQISIIKNSPTKSAGLFLFVPRPATDKYTISIDIIPPNVDIIPITFDVICLSDSHSLNTAFSSALIF